MTEPGEPGHRQPYPLRIGDVVSIRAKISAIYYDGNPEILGLPADVYYEVVLENADDPLGLTEEVVAIIPAQHVRRSILILPAVDENEASKNE